MNDRIPKIGVVLVVALLLLGACAHDPSEPLPTEATPMERIMNQRAKISELKVHPQAGQAGAEIGRAEAFLRRAELALDAESEMVPLLLDATDAQLARVQTLYARQRAEGELDEVNARFADEFEDSRRSSGATERPEEGE